MPTGRKTEAIASARKVLDDYLEMNNHRKTPGRYAILDAIYALDRRFTIDELYRIMRDERLYRLSKATLYNTMRLFIKLRLVVRHRFQGITKYEACKSHSGHIQQVCSLCGKVMAIHSPVMDTTVGELPFRRFHPDGYALYVYGICSSCMAKQTRQRLREERQKEKKKSK